MQPNPPPEDTLRRYVLGELDETDHLAIEQQVIATPGASEALALAEQVLIDEYLDEALSPVERTSFERRLATLAPLRQKVRFARRLRARASALWTLGPDGAPRPPARSGSALPIGGDVARRRTVTWTYVPVWAASLAAALVIVVGGTGWWVATGRRGDLDRLRAQHQQDQQDIDRLAARLGDLQARVAAAERERAAREAVAAPRTATALAPAGARPLAPPTFVLATGLVRSAGTLPRVVIPADAQIVRLRLPVAEAGRGDLRAVLYDAEGQERLAMSGLHASGHPPAVTVTVAADLLPTGDYELQLLRAGPETASTYPFRVTSR